MYMRRIYLLVDIIKKPILLEEVMFIKSFAG